jgi:hypothetical protein
MPSLGPQALGREHSNLIAACERIVTKPSEADLEFDVTPQSVAGGGDRHDADEGTGSIADDISGDDHSGSNGRWFMSNGSAEVYVVDLTPPDHARLSQACCSAKSASRSAGLNR